MGVVLYGVNIPRIQLNQKTKGTSNISGASQTRTTPTLGSQVYLDKPSSGVVNELVRLPSLGS